MNQITKIHLGRQAYTISTDAYHELMAYLDAIKKQVKDKEVVEEIELRMAELLAEHNIDANKVILNADVAMLKERLGDPDDFKEDEDESDDSESQPRKDKRLFRDTDNAIVAGVASGLANYLGLDVLLVRLLFVLLVILSFGWGILLYILLWILVPEAKTPSNRLQMTGKPVTVNNLKQVVEGADVKGAARRVSFTLAGPINRLFNLALKLVGLALILLGLTAIFSLISGLIYYLVNSNTWLKYNIFPVGLREHLLAYIALGVASLIAVFIVTIGTAILLRKWPVRSWVTGVLIGLLLLGIAVGGALTADVYPNVHNRYIANTHTTLRSLAPFNAVNSTDWVNYQQASKYYVVFGYYGHPNLSNITTTVKNSTLTIDTNQFSWQRDCNMLCIPNSYNLSITVYAPNAAQLENLEDNGPSPPPGPVMYKP